MENELREYEAQIEAVEERGENGAMNIKGYAVVFNTESQPIRGKFVEIIEKRAFDNVDLSDVFLLYNHASGSVLGSSKSGSLELRVDEKGLEFRAELPNTRLGRDTFELIKRGDVRGVSFGFIASKDSWNARVSPEVRTITQFKQVREISITPFPAYKETAVSTRSLKFLDECITCKADLNDLKSSDLAKEAKQIQKDLNK